MEKPPASTDRLTAALPSLPSASRLTTSTIGGAAEVSSINRALTHGEDGALGNASQGPLATSPPPKPDTTPRVTSPTSIAAENRSRAQLAAELSKVEMLRAPARGPAKAIARGTLGQPSSAAAIPKAQGGPTALDAGSIAARKEQNGQAKQPPVDEHSENLVPGVTYPASVIWDEQRPYLTGEFLEESSSGSRGVQEGKRAALGTGKAGLGKYSSAVQELLLIDDLLYAMGGAVGEYVQAKLKAGRAGEVSLNLDESMDVSLRELAKRILPLCESYHLIARFVEVRWHYKHGLVSHALAAALRGLMQDYQIMVAQLEHQFRLGKLSMQGLLFYSQPMMDALGMLASLVKTALEDRLCGADLLNLLQSKASALAGDKAARALLQKLVQDARAPYFRILERWVYGGKIDDPYMEFLIQEKKEVRKESLRDDYRAGFWREHYVLRSTIPAFLAATAETIRTTGKYLNAIRECGEEIKGPDAGEDTRLHGLPDRVFLERINRAHMRASQQLLDVLVQKENLMGRLRSMKHYFLLDQGDFLVHFMDIARDELRLRPAQISVEKLQSLLELALRTSVCSADPFHEDLTCDVERQQLISQLHSSLRSGPDGRPVLDFASLAEAGPSEGAPINISGLDTFTLDYKVRWPLTLVISRRALTKYQFIFRHLFHCKHVERQLCQTWQVHQTMRGLMGFTLMQPSYFLCQRMLHFIQTYQHYMTFEVLEPKWATFESKLDTAKTVDEVIALHDEFQDSSLKECMLFWPQILKRVEKVKRACLFYCMVTQNLVPAVSLPDDEDEVDRGSASGPPSRRPSVTSASSGGAYADFREQHKLRRELAIQHALQAAEDSGIEAKIQEAETAFNRDMMDLVVVLNSASQNEPYCAHLAQRLQGVGQGIAEFGLI